ncbi:MULTISPECIES: hypothetical protein [unclassified Actinomyces]|uniref:hypothetical protein n=1 Tax=unclassified Actinomyces TaxID=2609248 RepID=UPI0020181516|nr:MULTISPECIES: hypothetical protein [unclassified Actinomyces]MCL3777281.1 hypothetical protein [Actinomyces sp. AC-20-1]MCL3789586.1 hypothetical protein [Actinomyces sp. 187325]MCL3791871.1 hypothetical protein [Actinomyces sp. 186855]MCL3793643.1 hypothetical protein [Actinomyces sp. 217892]
MDTRKFVAARSKAEAVARLYSAADCPAPAQPLGPGSKERKDVLTATASRFALDVNTAAAKDVLAREIVEAFGGTWDTRYSSTGQTITLDGLNAVLAPAEERRRLETERELRSLDPAYPPGFHPARDKLEVVRRISSLTGGRPQDLGPGSKERKSVLTELVENLSLPVDARLSKTRLAEAITRYFGLTWTDACWSRGETLTLVGLNTVLAGAEQEVRRGLHASRTRLLQEAQLLVSALAHACPSHWEGRECVQQMVDAEHAKSRQTEWVGWYFEFIGLPALINAYGGGPRRVGATEFDYARAFVWDLKAHAQPNLRQPGHVTGEAPLNDRDSILRCVETTGSLGFLVLSGSSVHDDDGSFDTWHRKMRGSTTARTERSRTLKAAFTPVTVDAYVFQGMSGLESALEKKVLTPFHQGRQASGAARAPKLKLNLGRGREEGYVMASSPLTMT